MKLKMDLIVVWVFIFFVGVKSFAGPIGLIFQPINYIPTLLMLVLLMKSWLLGAFTKPAYLLSVLLIIVYYLIGILNSSFIQATFGLYIFIPFLYCATYNNYIFKFLTSGKNSFFMFFFITCGIGVLYVSYFGAPWLGGAVNVGGVDKVLSRNWTVNGVLRNPGFVGASFDAATLLMICAFFLTYNYRKSKKYIPLVITLITALYLIYLTTTKTTIVTLAVVTLFMFIPRLIATAAVKFLFFVIIIFSYIYMVPEQKYNAYDPSNTLLIRMYYTWPKAAELLNDSISTIFGKGIGAAGTAAAYFSPKLYNPGDNVFVYLYIIGGVVSVILILILFFKFCFSRFHDSQFKKIYYLFSLCILTGGVTYNVFESAFYSLGFGLIVGGIFNKDICKLSLRNRTEDYSYK